MFFHLEYDNVNLKNKGLFTWQKCRPFPHVYYIITHKNYTNYTLADSSTFRT